MKITINTTITKNKVFYTSDSHFFHRQSFIWADRGYSSPEEHTFKSIDKINEQAKPEDFIFNLGDFGLNYTQNDFETIISKINCQNIYYIRGNHNSRIDQAYRHEVYLQFNRDDIEVYPIRYKNIIFVGDYVEATVDKQLIIMQHYPLYSWNQMRKFSIHLFGHLHCKGGPKEGKCMDVGFDRDKKMYSHEEIIEIMSKKQIVSDGSHH